MDLKTYQDYLCQPWARLYYQLVYAQLDEFKNLKILDFGSGIGKISAFLAQNNEVLAIEPNSEIVKLRENPEIYTQLIGSLDILENIDDEQHDLVICHNVLEYISEQERDNYFREFNRVLKKGGRLSIVKHNLTGKIIHKAVFENQVDEALKLLLEDENCYQSVSFSQGQVYSSDDLIKILEPDFSLQSIQGLRCLYALQKNEFKLEPDWLEKMYKLELSICDSYPYKDLAFFQHLKFVKK